MEKEAVDILELVYKLYLDNVNVPYDYTNIYEFFVGFLLSAVIVACIDKVLHKIAYALAGKIADGLGASRWVKSTIHWALRFIILIPCAFIISNFIDITPPTQTLAEIIKVKYEGYWDGITKQIIDAITNVPK